MCIEPPTLRDRLSLKFVASPPRKKSRTTFKSQVVNSKEDEKRTCSDEMGGGGVEKLQTTVGQGNLEEEPEPNLDQAIDSIQVEHVKPIVPIAEPT